MPVAARNVHMRAFRQCVRKRTTAVCRPERAAARVSREKGSTNRPALSVESLTPPRTAESIGP
jgi:hypothetical protein